MADLLIGSGGSQKINVCGAVIAKSVSLTGRIHLHFDEALMRKYWRGYTVTSWTEL